MVDLKLHHFTHDQIGETLLSNIINFVEKCIQQPFKWDPAKNNYNVLVCTITDDIVGVGIAKDPGILEYLCVDEKHQNQFVGLKILDHFIKIYSSLRMMVTPDIH